MSRRRWPDEDNQPLYRAEDHPDERPRTSRVDSPTSIKRFLRGDPEPSAGTFVKQGVPANPCRFWMPNANSPLSPCPLPPGSTRTDSCGHEACDKVRQMAKSPCMLCRRVIGQGVWILDERSDAQKDAAIFYVGFTHEFCRKRFKNRMQPKGRQRHIQGEPGIPVIGTPVHIDDFDDRERELRAINDDLPPRYVLDSNSTSATLSPDGTRSIHYEDNRTSTS